MEVGGSVAPGYEGVRDAFVRNFEVHGELGAGYALYVDGVKVVDVWGGVADRATGAPYTEDTLQLVFSSTKGATAACVNLLAERGEVDIDLPVARYWPEFAQAGKERIPVRHLLCHKAGLPTIDARLSGDDVLAWGPVIAALEVQAPLWEPGSAHGYHAVTFGYLLGEVVRRVTGMSIGTFFREEFAEPLGLDFWIGLPAEHEPRVARVVGGLGVGETESLADESSVSTLGDVLGPDSLIVRTLTLNHALDDIEHGFNNAALHAAEMPAANGITNARSLARLYAALVEPLEGGPAQPMLTREQVDKARTRQTEGPDRVMSFPGIDVTTAVGLGFFMDSRFASFGGEGGFGHTGAGGSVGFLDPEHRIAGGYVMNRMLPGFAGDPRPAALIRASYEAADRPLATAPARQ